MFQPDTYEKELIETAASCLAAVSASVHNSTDQTLIRPLLNEVLKERIRQERKWGDQGHKTRGHFLAVIMEELGEAAEASLSGRLDGVASHERN